LIANKIFNLRVKSYFGKEISNKEQFAFWFSYIFWSSFVESLNEKTTFSKICILVCNAIFSSSFWGNNLYYEEKPCFLFVLIYFKKIGVKPGQELHQDQMVHLYVDNYCPWFSFKTTTSKLSIKAPFYSLCDSLALQGLLVVWPSGNKKETKWKKVEKISITIFNTFLLLLDLVLPNSGIS